MTQFYKSKLSAFIYAMRLGELLIVFPSADWFGCMVYYLSGIARVLKCRKKLEFQKIITITSLVER